MSTKASPPTSSATASTNAGTSAGVVKIKSELPSDEIKEFAENTMNELLGWYGFDGVDRLDLSAKTSRLLQSAAAAAAASGSPLNHPMDRRRSRHRAATLLQMQQQSGRSVATNNNNNAIRNNNNIVNHNNSTGTGGSIRGGESTTSDHDTRSSREDDSKSPHSAGITTLDEKIDLSNCCWCRRPVAENAPEFLTTSDGPRYCSESCFTQSRRASFKKAKTCDWCKHVRHAVSYVDFQDGASQLQFCSDKCLNQYKMQIFCKETQAHLDMNPHLREQALEAAASGNSAGLITPDLWLRNCRSRSASPSSTLSASPGPGPIGVPSSSSAPSARAPSPLVAQAPQPAASSTGHKPMISVAPVSKLMSKSPAILHARQSPKHSRKKRPFRTGQTAAGAESSPGKPNLGGVRREMGGLGLGVGSSQMLATTKSLLNVGKANSLRTSPGQGGASSSASKASTPSLSQFAASSVQDLHMSVPPLSPMLDQPPPPQPPTHPHPSPHPALVHPGPSGRGTSIPATFFATPPGGQQQGAMPPQPPPPLTAGFPPRPQFLPNAAPGLLPRFPYLQPYAMHPTPEVAGMSSLLGSTPPVTVMVPYPIIIPLPIPIPVPLPIIDFYKAYLTPEQRQKFKQDEKNPPAARPDAGSEAQADRQPCPSPVSERFCNSTDEPLDFTKSKESTPTPTPRVHNSNASPFPVDSASDSGLSHEAANVEVPAEKAQHPQSHSAAEDEPPLSDSQVTHCIAPFVEKLEEPAVDDGNKPADAPQGAHEDPEQEDAKQKLPKFKITRLHTKRTLIQTKESECSRPLRKRKRIIDCDFQKITLTKDSEQEDQAEDDVASTTSTPAGHSQTKGSSKK